MRTISMLLTLIGVILIAIGVAGRFYGASTVFTFKAPSWVLIGNSSLLLGLLTKSMEKK